MRILILGANSYIGKHLKGHLEQYPADYRVTARSQRDDRWKELDFSVFDSVVDCVGVIPFKEVTELPVHKAFVIPLFEKDFFF